MHENLIGTDLIQRKDECEDWATLEKQFSFLSERLNQALSALDDYKTACSQQGLAHDSEGLEVAENLAAAFKQRLEALDLKEIQERNDVPHGVKVDHFKRVFRALLHGILSLTGTFEWSAGSQKHTDVPMNFRLGSSSVEVLYDRHGSEKVLELESKLQSLLDFNPDAYSLFLTSSGMAAYQLIESYLLRKVLKHGDNIMRVGNIYFEVNEQITSLNAYSHSQTSTEARDIQVALRAGLPKVIFVEPLNNDLNLRMVDLASFFNLLLELNPPEDIFIVIDVTMLPGGTDYLFNSKHPHIKVIYFSSCGKYLQSGLDKTMAGFVVTDRSLEGDFQTLRRMSGSILHEASACLLVVPNKEDYCTRSSRLDRNAGLLAHALNEDDRLEVHHPRLPQHPDFELAEKIASLGAVLTFRFRKDLMNTPASLQKFIDLLLDESRSRGIPMTQGVSFGFSHPRITLAFSTQPYTHLRLSCGDRSFVETLAFKEVLTKSVNRFFENHDKVVS